MICEEFKGSKKDFKKEKRIKGTTGSSREEVGRHRQSSAVGKAAVVSGPSKVSENEVEKFLGGKRNCDLGTSLPLATAHRLKGVCSMSVL